VVVSRPGIAAARQFIYDFFPSGYHIIQFDDDVKAVSTIARARNGKPVPLAAKELPAVFEYDQLRKNGTLAGGSDEKTVTL
jgi:hypothetical protein